MEGLQELILDSSFLVQPCPGVQTHEVICMVILEIIEEALKTCTAACQQGPFRSSHVVYGSDQKCYMLIASDAQSVEGE